MDSLDRNDVLLLEGTVRGCHRLAQSHRKLPQKQTNHSFGPNLHHVHLIFLLCVLADQFRRHSTQQITLSFRLHPTTSIRRIRRLFNDLAIFQLVLLVLLLLRHGVPDRHCHRSVVFQHGGKLHSERTEKHLELTHWFFDFCVVDGHDCEYAQERCQQQQ